MSAFHTLRICTLASALIALSSCGSTGDNFKISGSFPDAGTVGTAYAASLTAEGGDGGDAWTVLGLPPGLTVSGTSGATLTASGTPSTPGTYSVSASVKDTRGTIVVYSASVVVKSQPLTISPSTLVSLTAGQTTGGVTFTATPATAGPYTWTLSSGTLPAGLLLSNGSSTSATTIQSDTNSITLLGTPSASGFYSFTVGVSDGIAPVADTGSVILSGVIHAGTTACAPVPMPRGNEAALTSPYAFVVEGTDANRLPIAFAGSITPDGNGGIAVAAVDYAGTAAGAQPLTAIPTYSSYSYGADGRGCLYFVFQSGKSAPSRKVIRDVIPELAHASPNAHREVSTEGASGAPPETATFSFALTSSGSGRISEFDSAGGAGPIAAGAIHVQNPNQFSLAALGSNYVFGMDGWYTLTSTLIDRASLAGSFANQSGAISNGYNDVNLAGNYLGEQINATGTLGAVSPATGRGTGTYDINVGGTNLGFEFAYYVIDSSDFFLISTDNPSDVGAFLVTGRALAGLAESQPPNGYFLAAWTGIDLTSGPNGANFAAIANFQATSDGAIPSITVYQNDAGTFSSAPISGSYTITPLSSRVTISGFPNPPVAYLAAPNQDDGLAGFLAGTDAYTSSGVIEIQTGSTPTYATSSLDGNFIIGSTEDPTGQSGSVTGAGAFNGTGTYSDVRDAIRSDAAPATDQLVSAPYFVNSDGSGSVANGAITFVTSGSVVFAINSSSSATQPLLYVLLKQSPEH